MKITVTLIQVTKRIQVIDNLNRNQLLAPVSLVVKDIKKGEIQTKERPTRENPGGSNCSDSGSKKKEKL